MNLLRRYLPLIWFFAVSLGFAAEAAKSGYQVSLELSISETGAVEATKVVASDDKVLDGIAEQIAKKMKLPVRQKDGVPVKYRAVAPLSFPVEGDGGPEAQKGPMPTLHPIKKSGLPLFPFELHNEKKGGGAILQLRIDAKGRVADAKIVRTSNSAYASSAIKAVKTWQFDPAKVDGQPVEVVRYQAFVFEMDDAKAELQWYLAPRPCLELFTISGSFVPAGSQNFGR